MNRTFKALLAAVIVLTISACTTLSGAAKQDIPEDARIGLIPLTNLSQVPQAGERNGHILLSILAAKNLQPMVFSPEDNGQPALLNDGDQTQEGIDWAKEQNLDYIITGSIEEWRYKNGLNGEPAVGISLRIIKPESGKVIWSASAARSGWSRESLSAASQKVLKKLVSGIRFE